MMNKTNFKLTEIGEIPEDWNTTLLSDVAIVNENTINNDYKQREIEYIDVSSTLTGELLETQKLSLESAPSRAKRIVSDKDILISTVRPNLKHFAFISKSKPNLVASTGYSVVSAKKINSRFLYYYLTTDEYTKFLSAIADTQTSTYPAFNPDVLENSIIPLPASSEQQQIASILSSLDDKIELNRKMNKTLGEIGKALFKRWFVDFEFPFDFAQGKPNDDGKPYKSSGGEMVDSGLGEIPEGWEVKPLDAIATFLNGVACQKYPPKDEVGLPVIKIGELHNGITENSDRVSSSIASEYIIEDGDVLFSWSGSLEIVLWTGGRGVLNQHLFKVSSECYPKWFCYQWALRYLPFFREIASNKVTTMGHIQRSHLTESLVLVPQKTTLEKMDLDMTPLLDKIIANSIEIKSLAQIRDSLLPRLMSGKLRVS